MYGYNATHGYLMFSKFRTSYYVNLSVLFQVQNLFDQIPIPYT